MGVFDATLKLVMVMVVVVVMMMMTTMMTMTTMTMMGIIMMMMMMMMMMLLLIKNEVGVLQFNRPMSIYLNLYLALEGLGNETKEIVLRLSNDNAFLLVYSPEPQCQV